MSKKSRRIVGIIATALFSLNCLVQAVALILASDPVTVIEGLFGSDGETAVIVLMFVIFLVVVWIVTLGLCILQCLSALIGRVPGLVMSPIGLVLNIILTCLAMTIFGAVTASENDISIGGTLLFAVTCGWMTILSVANFIYVLTEFCVYKGEKNKSKDLANS